MLSSDLDPDPEFARKPTTWLVRNCSERAPAIAPTCRANGPQCRSSCRVGDTRFHRNVICRPPSDRPLQPGQRVVPHDPFKARIRHGLERTPYRFRHGRNWHGGDASEPRRRCASGQCRAQLMPYEGAGDPVAKPCRKPPHRPPRPIRTKFHDRDGFLKDRGTLLFKKIGTAQNFEKFLGPCCIPKPLAPKDYDMHAHEACPASAACGAVSFFVGACAS